jgi:hypothetical protein
MASKQLPGVFALEGDWQEDLRRGGSMRPVFEVLALQEYLQVVHRDVGTTTELSYYSQKWTQRRYSAFKLVYLAFHGNPGRLWVGDDSVDMDGLAGLVGDACRGRIVHFGSCSTMRVSAERLSAFKKQTGAVAVSGYQRDVDWLESCAFETLLIGALMTYKTRPGAFKYVERTMPDLASRLGWHHV